jgi:hypothetical protein
MAAAAAAGKVGSARCWNGLCFCWHAQLIFEAYSCVLESQPRRRTIGKGPGIELDVTAASEVFVPTTKAVKEAVPALHKVGAETHPAIAEAAVALALVRKAEWRLNASGKPSTLRCQWICGFTTCLITCECDLTVESMYLSCDGNPQDPSQAVIATETLRKACGDDAAKLDLAITAVTGGLAVIREAVKRRTAYSKIAGTLEACNFPATFAAVVSTAIAASATEIEDAAFEGAIALPGLQSFRWRVDVHIASSSAARVLRPSVMAELTLTDGTVHTMSMTPEQFHELRYGVAKTLKSMIDDEAHFVLRLAADMERAAKRNQAK